MSNISIKYLLFLVILFFVKCSNEKILLPISSECSEKPIIYTYSNGNKNYLQYYFSVFNEKVFSLTVLDSTYHYKLLDNNDESKLLLDFGKGEFFSTVLDMNNYETPVFVKKRTKIIFSNRDEIYNGKKLITFLVQDYWFSEMFSTKFDLCILATYDHGIIDTYLSIPGREKFTATKPRNFVPKYFEDTSLIKITTLR